MLDLIEFQNFKILRNATLPLAPFTLIVGPNGSGKSTALQALLAVEHTAQANFKKFVTAGLKMADNTGVEMVHSNGTSYMTKRYDGCTLGSQAQFPPPSCSTIRVTYSF